MSEFDQEFQVTEEEEGQESPEIMDELWNSEQDTPQEEPEEEVQEEPESEPEEEDEREDEEEPEEEETEEPEEEMEEEEPPKTFKIGDKEYDLDTLVKEGKIDDLVTQANQVAHFQKLYEEQKAKNEERQVSWDQLQQMSPQQINQLYQQGKLTQEQAQQIIASKQQQQVNPQQIIAQMAPHVNAAVKEGWIEPDFAEMYPNSAASQMMAYSELQQMKQMVMGMYQYFMRQVQDQNYSSAKNQFSSACSALTGKHPIYQALNDSGEQEEFFDYLAKTVNPEVDNITEEFLAKQYLAYKQESVLEAVRSPKPKKKKKKRKLAAGDGPSPRKQSKRKKQTENVDHVVIDGLMEAFNE